MGTKGYKRAADLIYNPDEVILEVGSGESTYFLAGVGPVVVTIDPAFVGFWTASNNVQVHSGYAENVLKNWQAPIGFAWLDGWDWPYDGNPPEYYAEQEKQYSTRGDEYSQRASQRSHLRVAELISGHARVIAFDDTWRTHRFDPEWQRNGRCQTPVPPATTPAPKLAMDQALGGDHCWLGESHPHHNNPERGWDGKGGTAIPYLLDHGYRVMEYGLGVVILKRDERWIQK